MLGLPRGGVVVAAQIATALAAPLDVLVVRKLGAPAQPELAIGAVTSVLDSSQANEICAGVCPCFSATSTTRSAMSKVRSPR